ncbi:MAG: hypothetical protein QM493_01980, partial [Sulfurovum sp.]
MIIWILRFIFINILIFGLNACGGGGGGTAPATGDGNTSKIDKTVPIFTSSNTVIVAENQTSLLTLTATDENSLT